MHPLLKLALRNLTRNRRRSFFSALALGIGLALMLLMSAFFEGEMRQSLDASIRLNSGHLQVRAVGYDEDKASLAWEDLIAQPQALAAQVATLPVVVAATPRLYASAMVAYGEDTVGVRLMGVDPASPANAPYRDGLVAGQFLAADDREGVLLGKTLADDLGLAVGDRLNLLANTANGDLDGQEFTVRGIFSTKVPGYDQGTILMPLAKAQALTRAEDHASVLFVLLADRAQTGAAAAALQGGAYEVVTWEELNALLIQFDEFGNAYVSVLYLIVLGITATVIVNTLVMAVFERTREIGILAAIGMRPGRIRALFLIESGLLALGGVALGLILGSLLALYGARNGFYIGNMGVTGIPMGERIYPVLTAQAGVNLAIMALVITCLAALYPAALAARMEPVHALHGGE